jgi:hypothetical protein
VRGGGGGLRAGRPKGGRDQWRCEGQGPGPDCASSHGLPPKPTPGPAGSRRAGRDGAVHFPPSTRPARHSLRDLCTPCRRTHTDFSPPIGREGRCPADLAAPELDMAQPAARKRITPVLVALLDPSVAGPGAGGAGDDGGAAASAAALSSPGGAAWRAIPPAAPPADPNAVSSLGPARRIYVDLSATAVVNFREVGAAGGWSRPGAGDGGPRLDAVWRSRSRPQQQRAAAAPPPGHQPPPPPSPSSLPRPAAEEARRQPQGV